MRGCIAAALLVAPGIGLLRIDRMVVPVEPQQVRALAVFIVGDEQVGAVADEQAFLIQEPQRAQAPRRKASRTNQRSYWKAIRSIPVCARARPAWAGKPQCLFQPVDGGQHAPVEPDQSGAGLAEAAVVFRQLAEAGALASRERSQARFAVLGPGKHGRGVERSLPRGAVAGGLAAASLEFVDGALNELTQREHFVELPLGVGQQRSDGQAQTASPLRGSGGQSFPLYAIYCKTVKDIKTFPAKNDVTGKIFFWAGEAASPAASARRGARSTV